jgi:ATP-binding cassette subfamily B protein
MVAQRISTIKDADSIVVLDGGRVAAVGTHSYLLANCPVYRELAASQKEAEQ